ncbi:MAG: tetratricopeptide repeat protein, partial [Chloroflexales bacterium]
MTSAERLLATFFQELWRDGQVDRAMAAARMALRGSSDWWQAALFMRVPDGRLWLDAAPTAPTPAPAGPVIPPPPQPERPPDLTGFVGRATELDTFSAPLAQTGLVVLTGMPGVGKTSMAAALARRVGAPPTTFWHSFQANEGTESLIWDLAGFLAHQGRAGLWELLQRTRLSGGQSPPMKVLIDYLVQMIEGADCLICLDDFHLVDEDALAVFATCFQIGERLQSRKVQMTCLSNLGRIHLLQGHPAQAVGLLNHALDLSRSSG